MGSDDTARSSQAVSEGRDTYPFGIIGDNTEAKNAGADAVEIVDYH